MNKLYITFCKQLWDENTLLENFEIFFEKLIAYQSLSSDIYIHVEISIDHPEYPFPITYSCTRQGIRMMKRDFKSTKYEYPYYINLDTEEHKEILDFLEKQKNKPFNNKGYFFNHLPIISNCYKVSGNQDSYYCSEFACIVLSMLSCMKKTYIDPLTLKPNDLHTLISENKNFKEMLNFQAEKALQYKSKESNFEDYE